MKYLDFPIYPIAFFMKNLLICQPKNKFSSEKLIKKFSKNNYFSFLIFFMALKRTENFDIIFISIIWVKNFIFLEFKNFTPLCQLKFVDLLLDFLVSSPFRIFRQFVNLLKIIFQIYTDVFPEAKFLLKKIKIKIELKKEKKNKKEFLSSVLSIIKILDPSSIAFLTFDTKHNLIKFWKILGGSKDVRYSNNLNFCLSLILKIFFSIQNRVSKVSSFKNFEKIILTLIYLLLEIEKKKHKILAKGYLELEEKIYSFVLVMTEEKEEELTPYIPIIFKFGVKKLHPKNKKKPLAIFSWISLLLSSINCKILFRFDFFSINLFFFILSLIQFKAIEKKKLSAPLKLMSFYENLCFQKKNFIANKIISSLKISVRKKFFLFFFKKLFEIEKKVNKYSYYYSLRWACFFCKKKGSSVSGFFVILKETKCQEIVTKYTEIFFNLVEENSFVNLIDFFVFFRYQLSVKKLSKIITIILNYLGKPLKEIHSVILQEKFLSLRGNDNKKILMIFFEEEKRNNYLLWAHKSMKSKLIQNRNQENLCKLLMRLSTNSLDNKKFIKTKSKIFPFYYAEMTLFKNREIFSTRYLLETIFLEVLSQQSISQIFLSKIRRLSNFILTLNIANHTPFVFEIFGWLALEKNNITFSRIQKQLFWKSVNPLAWMSKQLSNSILKFLCMTFTDQNNILKKNEMVSLLTIVEIYYCKFGESEELIHFIIFLIENLGNNVKIISHLIEIFYHNFLMNPSLFSISFLLDLLVLLVKKKGIFIISKETNKLKKNFIIFFFYRIFYRNFLKTIFSFYSDRCYSFLELYFLKKFSLFESLFFEKITEKIIRKLIYDSRYMITKKKSKSIKENFRFSLFLSNRFNQYVFSKQHLNLENTLNTIKNFSNFFSLRIKII